jgi:hypothetical protein
MSEACILMHLHKISSVLILMNVLKVEITMCNFNTEADFGDQSAYQRLLNSQQQHIYHYMLLPLLDRSSLKVNSEI